MHGNIMRAHDSVQCAATTAGCHALTDRDTAADKDIWKVKHQDKASTLHFPTLHLLFFLALLCWSKPMIVNWPGTWKIQAPETGP